VGGAEGRIMVYTVFVSVSLFFADMASLTHERGRLRKIIPLAIMSGAAKG
jgi:hypothetical protein